MQSISLFTADTFCCESLIFLSGIWVFGVWF